jgi:hypothetical protein
MGPEPKKSSRNKNHDLTERNGAFESASGVENTNLTHDESLRGSARSRLPDLSPGTQAQRRGASKTFQPQRCGLPTSRR